MRSGVAGGDLDAARREEPHARPLVVLEGPRQAVGLGVSSALGAAERDGWRIIVGWAAPLSGERVVCTGNIRSADDARRALLAAVSGAGLVVAATADRETVDRFVDDLGRFGAVDHRPGGATRLASGRPGQRAVLALLAEGLSLDETAAELGISRRTAARRLAGARARSRPTPG